MKKSILFLFALLSLCAYSQQDAWIYFNAKPNSQTFISNPLMMLSQRALDRRTAQNIALDFKDAPIEQAFVNQVDALEDVAVVGQSKWLNAVHVRGTIAAITTLADLPFVGSVDFADNSLDAAGRKSTHGKTVQVGKTLETLADFPYGASASQIEILNGHLLHQQDFTGSGKIIAVLDAGFPEVDVIQPFQRIRDNGQILGGYNFVDRNTDYYSRNGHGTLVLSTMAGYTENELVGTAPDASYYLFISEDINSETPLEETLWVEAAEMADSLGVDIINSSLGYFSYDNPNYSYTYADLNGVTSFVSRGADIAFSRGMIVVSSAGNSGGSANPYIAVPADAVNVLAVGAVNYDGLYAGFSSTGPAADGRIKPDVMAIGQGAVVSGTNGNISSASGTSFSGPIIAGMVASFWQALPELTNAQIVQLIKQSANFFATPNAEYGYGIPDFSQALESGLSVPEFSIAVVVANGSFAVNFPNDTADVLIYSVSGQKVLDMTLHTQNSQIALDHFSSGVYFYKVRSGKYTKTGKFIKQ